MRREGFVYFARAKNSGFVKIGWAKTNPEARVQSFQCGCPEPLEILGVIEGGRDLEAAYHKVYGLVRLRGEWFWPLPCLMQHVGYPQYGRYVPGSLAEMRERFAAGEPFTDVVPASYGLTAETFPG